VRLRIIFAIGLILGIMLIGIGCSEAQKITEKPETDYVIGGPCIYSHYPGRATITRIEKTEESKNQTKTSGGPGYEGYEVWFVFKPDQEIKEDWARKSMERERLFRLANSWYPGPQYLKKYNIKVGNDYPCTLKVQTRGTCTPIIFEFGQLKRDDYFESHK